VNLTVPSRAPRGAVQAGFVATAFAGALLSLTASAQAQTVSCDSLPNPIYGVGGSAATPLIKRVAQILAAQTDSTQTTVIYQDPGACFAMQSLVSGTKLTGTAKYWTPDATTDQTCTLPTAGVDAQWGAMAQLATTCPGIAALPATVGDFLGPISGFSIIANAGSSQEVISAEALYSVYGLGPQTAAIAPWTNLATLGSRTTTSAAGLLLAKAVGLPLTRSLAGTDDKNQSGVITKLTSPAATADQTALDSTLGFIATEAADAQRGKNTIKTLAYQHKDQLTGYYPDSTPSASDKVNIREGRYFLWNPHHFFAKQSDKGVIADEKVATFIAYFTGDKELPGKKPFIDVTIANGNIPTCAMHVTRDDDMGPLASFQAEEPCDCYYEAKATGKAPATCKTCASDTDCKGESQNTCRLGYCEVK
jgi:hypothetical protein